MEWVKVLKALILAGGYGTRLRPLSCRKPKLLFPILCKSVLERNLETLSTVGVNEVVLAVNYLSDTLMKTIGRNYADIRIRYSIEKTALGTGGPIRKGMRFLSGEDMFLVMNGDVLFDDRIKGIVDIHNASKAIGTIALREVEDTTRFGVALLEEDGGIKGFVEKPKPGVVDSRWVNAGVYVFSKEIFKYIPYGKKVSTEREVFPILAKEDKLHGFRYLGYWNDIGKVEDFINVNRRFMELLPKDGIEVDEAVTFEGDVHLKPPVKICKGSFIGSNAILGPYTVIGKGCKVCGGSSVSESILFNDCLIQEKAKIDGSILGDNVSIGVGATLIERVIVGTGVTVGDGVHIVGGVSICPYKEVVEDILESCHIV